MKYHFIINPVAGKQDSSKVLVPEIKRAATACSFLPADLPAFRFHFLPLSLKRLLGLRTETGILQILSGIPEPSFRIISRLPGFRFDGRTKDQFIVVV